MDTAPSVQDVSRRGWAARLEPKRVDVLVDRAREDLTIGHARSSIEDAPGLEAVEARTGSGVQHLERGSGAVDDEAVVVCERWYHDAGGTVLPFEGARRRVDGANGSVDVGRVDRRVSAGREKRPSRK